MVVKWQWFVDVVGIRLFLIFFFLHVDYCVEITSYQEGETAARELGVW